MNATKTAQFGNFNATLEDGHLHVRHLECDKEDGDTCAGQNQVLSVYNQVLREWNLKETKPAIHSGGSVGAWVRPMTADDLNQQD